MTEVKEFIESAPYAADLGVQVESIDESSARLVLPFKEINSNPGNALHGGVAASMINLGGLSVARAALGEQAGPLHTASIQVTYLAAAIGEPIIAEATLLRRGKELCFVDTAIRTEDGKAIARGLSTVRGRFNAPDAPPVKTVGDHGESDPGPMGAALGQRVSFIGRLGLEVEHMAGGSARIAMAFKDINADLGGGVHEGPVLALLDTAGAMAAWAVTGPGRFKASTVGIQAQMVAPAPADGCVAYGHVIQQDREIFWSNVEVASATSGNVVARGTVLYRIVVPEEK